MTLAEMLAMYCLVWSPAPWQVIAYDAPALGEKELRLTGKSRRSSKRSWGLPQCARLMAHVPSLMILMTTT